MTDKSAKAFWYFGFYLFLGSILCSQISCASKELTSTNNKNQTIRMDSLLFVNLAKYASFTGFKHNDARALKQLQIDPQLVDSTSAEFFQLEKKYLQKSNPKLLQQRISILKNLAISQANAVMDQECVFSQGLPEPPDPDKPPEKKSATYPQRCEKKGFFVTIIFSEPEFVTNNNCTDSNEALSSKSLKCWQIRAYEYTSYSRFIFALYLIKDPKQGWKVVRKERLWGEFS